MITIVDWAIGVVYTDMICSSSGKLAQPRVWTIRVFDPIYVGCTKTTAV